MGHDASSGVCSREAKVSNCTPDRQVLAGRPSGFALTYEFTVRFANGTIHATQCLQATASVLVHVRFFASHREAIGRDRVDLQLNDNATAADAYASICRQFPSMRPEHAGIAFAVNQQHVKPAAVLKNGDELAILPPVAGG
ncbi:MAG: MoaD/ThiS family protein [Candidatus Eremiobacter antarcticus]